MNRPSEIQSNHSQYRLCSMVEIPSYVSNTSKNPYVAHLDRMTAQQHYECFPEYFYNSAFGSLLSGPTCSDRLELKENLPENPCRSVYEPIHGICSDSLKSQPNQCDTRAYSNICENSSTTSLSSKLCVYFSEFIPYLSCIAQSQPACHINEQRKLFDVIEQLQQLQLTLTEQMNPRQKDIPSVGFVDHSTISNVLHQIRCLLNHLMNQEQCSRMIQIPMHMNRLNYFFQRLQTLIMMHSKGQNVLMTSESKSNLCIPWPFLEPAQHLCPVDYSCTPMFPIEEIVSKRKRKRRSATQHLEHSETSEQMRSNDISPLTPATWSMSNHGASRPISREESAEKELSDVIKTGRISATSLSSMLSKKFKQITGSRSSHEQSSQQSRLVSAKGSPIVTSSIDSVEHSFATPNQDGYQQSNGHSSWSDQTHGYEILSHDNERNTGLTPKLVLRYESSTDDVSNQRSTPSLALHDDYGNRSPSSSYKLSSPKSVSSLASTSGRQTPIDRNQTQQKENDLIIVSPSVQSYEAGSPRSDFIASSPSSPFPIDETNSHLNFNPSSPSLSQRGKDSSENIPHLNVIEGPRSAEGIDNSPLINNAKTVPIQKTFDNPKMMDYDHSPKRNYYGQQSGSATSSSSDYSLSMKSHQKSASKDVLSQRNGLENRKRVEEQLATKTEGYFSKFMSCIRRTMVNRVENKKK